VARAGLPVHAAAARRIERPMVTAPAAMCTAVCSASAPAAISRGSPFPRARRSLGDLLNMTITCLTWLFAPIISNEKVRHKPMAYDHDIMTMKEICDLLRVHPATIYRLLRNGELPAFRIGSEWRFRTDMILRWMAENSDASSRKKKSI
jgi:excisionase family DNA binding protein